jgi:sortase (surface protein transpeptidase)
LTLVTCYPFEAIAPGTPLRYVVEAEVQDQPVMFPPVKISSQL